MSFDLLVLDQPNLASDIDALYELMEDESGWNERLTPALSLLVDELAAEYPRLDQGPDTSPWSSWPLETNSTAAGRCLELNISWSHADRMLSDVTERCRRHGLTVYDPQGDVVHTPDSDRKPRRVTRWWRRR